MTVDEDGEDYDTNKDNSKPTLGTSGVLARKDTVK